MGTPASPLSSRIDPFPALHIRPVHGWVNDPNGIGAWDGRWHVMYQWNPAAPVHGDIHWGHMSSSDLLTWRDEGVALRPRPGNIDAAGVWSGVAVAEPDGVALVYTAVPDHAGHAEVAVARPDGHGRWIQPDHTASEVADHSRWREVRDPFVVHVGDRRLGIMGAGLAGARRERVTEDGGRRPRSGAVLVYDANDLDDWRLLGTLLTADELPDDMDGAGAIWECPQLVAVDGRWMLVVSWDDGTTAPGPDGIEVRRLGVTAYVGELCLDAPTPRFVAATEAALDHGPDFYAPQLVVDGDRVLAWAWSWEGRGTGTNARSDADTRAAGWAGTLTFPREIVIDHRGIARCLPAGELDALRGAPIECLHTDQTAQMQTREPAWTLTTAGGVQIDLVDESTGSARAVWNDTGEGPIRIFVDGSLLEAFAPTGSTTRRAYPAPGELWRVRTTGAATAAVLALPPAHVGAD